MAARLLRNRNRALAFAAAIALHGVIIALLLILPQRAAPISASARLIAIVLAEPPPPTPTSSPEPAAAPASRGADEAPSPLLPPRLLPSPRPARPAADVGSGEGAGAGMSAGSGAGADGFGTGGAALSIPPRRIAGELTNADYRRVRPPEGAAGTVLVSFRIGVDGQVDGCRVLRSSGFAIFDEATCRLIERRFRYEPARDGAGRPISWEIRTDYTWAPR
jgi:protein TonB